MSGNAIARAEFPATTRANAAHSTTSRARNAAAGSGTDFEAPAFVARAMAMLPPLGNGASPLPRYSPAG